MFLNLGAAYSRLRDRRDKSLEGRSWWYLCRNRLGVSDPCGFVMSDSAGHMERKSGVLRTREGKRRKTQHQITDVFFSKPHTSVENTAILVYRTRRMLIEEEEESDEGEVFIHNVVYESAVITGHN